MSATSARNQDGQALPALHYSSVASVVVGATAASATITSAVVTLTPTVNTWFSVGGTAAAGAAGSDYLAAGTKWTEHVGPATAISFVSADGTAGYVAVKQAES